MLLHIYFDLQTVAQVIVTSFPIQVRNHYRCRPAQVNSTPMLGLIHLLLLNFISGYYTRGIMKCPKKHVKEDFVM